MSTAIELNDAMETTQTTFPQVLFVDLDDTLIQTDMLSESLVKIAKQNPLELLCTAPRLARGRAEYKAALAEIVVPDPKHLPYREEVVELLKQKKREGVKLVLATASPRPWAEAVAAHLGLFDDVLASDSAVNLKGRRKLAAIRESVGRDGYSSWAYIGDSHTDLPIFAAADHALLVSSSRRLQSRTRQVAAGPVTLIGHAKASWRDVLKALRPHQWAKNVPVFVPMILAHAFAGSQILASLLAWLCFSCVASGVYVLNDMLDVEADRRHPRKCRRPFAAGRLPLWAGPVLVTGLLGLGMSLALAALPLKFCLLLCTYWVLTTLYSAWLKNKLIVDVMVLAGLYTLRVIAGGAAVNVPVSEWLMAFSMFLFTSLAFAKRYAELARLIKESGPEATLDAGDTVSLRAPVPGGLLYAARQPHGRSYRTDDIGLLESVGPASGYLSVLVLALYVSSPQVAALYRNGWVLWYICPVLLYWITRVWLVAKRGRLSEDPVVFALRDGVSRFTGLIVAILMYVAVVL